MSQIEKAIKSPIPCSEEQASLSNIQRPTLDQARRAVKEMDASYTTQRLKGFEDLTIPKRGQNRMILQGDN